MGLCDRPEYWNCKSCKSRWNWLACGFSWAEGLVGLRTRDGDFVRDSSQLLVGWNICIISLVSWYASTSIYMWQHTFALSFLVIYHFHFFLFLLTLPLPIPLSCDGCSVVKPIVGPRYHCKECPNFDFCKKCFDQEQDHCHNFERFDCQGDEPVFVGLPKSVTLAS